LITEYNVKVVLCMINIGKGAEQSDMEKHMKKSFFVAVLLIFTMLFSTSVYGYEINGANGNGTQYYYVSNNGSDNNSGSKSKPFQTIQKAIDTAKAGATIYVEDGTYREEINFSHSGTEGRYITLRALNTGKAKLSLKKGQSGAILDLNGQSYIQIIGFDIGNVKAKCTYGILIGAGVHHVNIKNNILIRLL